MITGNIIGLRAIEEEDLKQLRDWRNVDSFRNNFREFRDLNMTNQLNWFAKLNASQNDFMFIIERLEDHKPLGACGLLYINWIMRSADFSFYIGFEGAYIDTKGFAKESARLLIEYAFYTLNLNKIWMELFQFDSLKLNFFTKEFAFRKDGTLRENCFKNGKYWDSYVISLLRSEYSTSSI